MSNRFQCPFCSVFFPLVSSTFVERKPSFYRSHWPSDTFASDPQGSSGLTVNFYNCPNCSNISIKIIGDGLQFAENYSMWFYPPSRAIQFPDYVPKVVREDYEKAYSILELSPKASATLSRRCIQSIVRDVFKVQKKTLHLELETIKDKIDPKILNALNSVRSIGNIGAHPEKDIDTIIEIEPHEAEKLIKLLEVIINEWYIVPHEKNILLDEIENIGLEKQYQRISGSVSME